MFSFIFVVSFLHFFTEINVKEDTKMKKIYIVSIITIAAAAIIAAGIATHYAKGNQEAQISGGKLMAETSVVTEAKVEYSAPIERREIDSAIIWNRKDYHKILNDETLRVRCRVIGFYAGVNQMDLDKIQNDSERFG
jgi:hypothetical protein